MQLVSLLRAQRRSPAGPLLMAAQVALTLMILANVAFVIYTRFETTSRPTGMNLRDTFWISSRASAQDFDPKVTAVADLQYLNAQSGIAAACVIGAIPQKFESTRSQVSVQPRLGGETRTVLVYQMSEQCLQVLELKIVRGRPFGKDSVLPIEGGGGAGGHAFGQEILITRSLAERLFGEAAQSLGKPLSFSMLNGDSASVVGIVDFMQAAPDFVPDDQALVSDIVFAPALPLGTHLRYLVRADAGRRDEVMQRIREKFERTQPKRFIEQVTSMQATADLSRMTDRNEAATLAILGSLVLAVTMLGIFGFASFAVTSRTREIGTRRALGATQSDVVKQFLLENWLITTAGIGVGILLTLVFALQLSLYLQMERVPILFLAGSMLLIWVGALLAALIPSLRAARLPPAIAGRA